jgi:hypothetical protein
MMAGKLITIAEFEDYIEASMAKQALDEEGIAAVVVGEKVSALYPGTPFAPILLQVNDTDEAAALEILKNFQNPPDLINPYEDGFDEEEDKEI